ncbi:LuxR C-terminal-related transcriptional regulator [Actinomadura sp. 9N407]|uniref:helix-turn-helix transcriptional regulator n=1 Tax=Actinomadura sp. 9N407 TaxID=3375154 RepID=UPI0037AF39B9
MSDVHRSSLAFRARQLLEGVVQDELLALYIPMLVQGGCPIEDATSLLGDGEHVELLIRQGMAYLQEEANCDSALVPASPELTLQRALARQAGDLASEHQILLEGQERLRAAQTGTGTVADGSMDQLVQFLTDQNRIAELTSTLAGSAQREWLILGDHIAGDQPVDGPRPSFSRTRCRAIYESGRIESLDGRESVDADVRAGATVRLLPQIGMSMRIADEAIALMPLAERASAGALLLQSSVIVGALREYFELLWERATPYGAPDRQDGPLPPIQMKILRLLVQDLPDKAIAEQLGVSLATVGRHLNIIRDALGVQNRFAVGAAAVQRGLVD